RDPPARRRPGWAVRVRLHLPGHVRVELLRYLAERARPAALQVLHLLVAQPLARHRGRDDADAAAAAQPVGEDALHRLVIDDAGERRVVLARVEVNVGRLAVLAGPVRLKAPARLVMT